MAEGLPKSPLMALAKEPHWSSAPVLVTAGWERPAMGEIKR
jgi:hypothetical protein